MARINIEESIWSDRRFIDLQMEMQSADEALGVLIRSWFLAQKWYRKDTRLIPFSEWKKQSLPDALFKVGLAIRVDENWVKVAGADEQFGWLAQRATAARKGGLSTQAQAKSSKIKQTQANATKFNPLTLPLPLNTKTNTSCALNEHEAEKIYQEFPKRRGSQNKKKGIERLKRILEDGKIEEIRTAVANYKTFCDSNEKTGTEYVQQFGNFMNSSWKEWIEINDERKNHQQKLDSMSLEEKLTRGFILSNGKDENQ